MTTRTLALLFGVWLIGVGFGVYEMYVYATTPGAAVTSPVTWPEASTLDRDRDAPTIVMFVTPDCPCTRASLAELDHVRRDAPHAKVIVSSDRAEADRFAARTSGYVVAYDAAGTLRFAGGITGSRGHTGDNIGRATLVAVISSADRIGTHAVFGCALGVGP